MTEFVTYKSKLPEFAAFPFTKRIVEEVLRDIPQPLITLSFYSWRSETTFRNKHAMKVSRKDVDIEVFSARYSQGNWTIRIFLIRKEKVVQIKELLQTEGFERLRNWFVEKAPVEEPNSPAYETSSHFDVSFDGQKLLYRPTE